MYNDRKRKGDDGRPRGHPGNRGYQHDNKRFRQEANRGNTALMVPALGACLHNVA